MKKILPLVLFVLLAFAGCQSGPATFEKADNPSEFIAHVEKFVNQVDKKSKHYNAEDWDAAINEFLLMSKNYVAIKGKFTQDDQMKYDNARMKFIYAIDANGTEEMVLKVKEEYARILGN